MGDISIAPNVGKYLLTKLILGSQRRYNESIIDIYKSITTVDYIKVYQPSADYINDKYKL